MARRGAAQAPAAPAGRRGSGGRAREGAEVDVATLQLPCGSCSCGRVLREEPKPLTGKLPREGTICLRQVNSCRKSHRLPSQSSGTPPRRARRGGAGDGGSRGSSRGSAAVLAGGAAPRQQQSAAAPAQGQQEALGLRHPAQPRTRDRTARTGPRSSPSNGKRSSPVGTGTGKTMVWTGPHLSPR